MDAKKPFYKIKHPSMIKMLSKLYIEKKNLNLINNGYQPPRMMIANIILNDEQLDVSH